MRATAWRFVPSDATQPSSRASHFSRLLKNVNVPVFASAAKQSSATFPEERSRFRSVRDRFLDCFAALAMTAEKTSSAAC
jgi:hypothetical protein